MKWRARVESVHTLKNEGYMNVQICEQLGMSETTVKRLLRINPESICVDGTQTRKSKCHLEPYRKQIQEMIERGIRSVQIQKKLNEMYPDADITYCNVKRFCRNLRETMYDYVETPSVDMPNLNENPLLSFHIDKINRMLIDSQSVKKIFTAIKADGFAGSYELFQQYCNSVRPAIYRIKKAMHQVKRRDLTEQVWSGQTDLPPKDIIYIYTNFPIISELRNIIAEFRVAYSDKDVDAVKSWCGKYNQCSFPNICAFINGLSDDTDAFYNSLKYDYNNGLLEGSVNKLKTIKRSMFGRASYALLRAKLLLANGL